MPEAALDRVMDQVADLGTLRSRGQSSQDVTDEYVDTSSRVRTQRESVARVRALLDEATDIDQIVQVESELSGRQADLESLEAQLASLQERTALATLTVSLSPPTRSVSPPVQADGFVAGLHGGWQALVASLAVTLTIVGALLPFVVLAGLVGGPAMLLVRRRRARAVTAPS